MSSRNPHRFTVGDISVTRRRVSITFEGACVDPDAIVKAVREAGLGIGCMRYRLHEPSDFQEDFRSFMDRHMGPLTEEAMRELLEGPKQVSLEF